MYKNFNVYGIRMTDSDKYKKMVSIYNNCKDLNIEPPEEVSEFVENDAIINDGPAFLFAANNKHPIRKDIIIFGSTEKCSYIDINIEKCIDNHYKFIRVEMVKSDNKI